MASSTNDSTGPVQVPDAGALFQKDRSGSVRSRELTEGQANFSTMAQRAQDAVDACSVDEEE